MSDLRRRDHGTFRRHLAAVTLAGIAATIVLVVGFPDVPVLYFAPSILLVALLVWFAAASR